jgi:hypothetical protein
MGSYARLSQAAYKGGKGEVSGWEIVRERDLTNRNRTTYRNPKTGKVVIAYRGTNPSNLADLATDALAALNLQRYSSRFNNATKAAETAVELFGEGNVSTTGHSLGAMQSLYVNSKLGLTSHAYNPFIAPHAKGSPVANVMLLNMFADEGTDGNAHIYQTVTDPLLWASAAVAPLSTIEHWNDSNHHFIQPKLWDGHGIRNFIED